jgi:hypothetical protein
MAHPEKPDLVTIPPELRLIIYDYLLAETWECSCAESARHEPGMCCKIYISGSLALRRPCDFYPVQNPVSLLLTCKPISREFSQTLHDNTEFTLQLSTLQKPDCFLSLKSPAVLKRIRKLRLTLVFVEHKFDDGFPILLRNLEKFVNEHLDLQRPFRSHEIRLAVQPEAVDRFGALDPMARLLAKVGRQPEGFFTCVKLQIVPNEGKYIPFTREALRPLLENMGRRTREENGRFLEEMVES